MVKHLANLKARATRAGREGKLLAAMDADVVLFLSQHAPTDTESHNAVLTVAKNRNGETGHLRLTWDAPRTPCTRRSIVSAQ